MGVGAIGVRAQALDLAHQVGFLRDLRGRRGQRDRRGQHERGDRDADDQRQQERRRVGAAHGHRLAVGRVDAHRRHARVVHAADSDAHDEGGAEAGPEAA